MHGCGGWLGLVLYIGPGWGYGGGPRRGVGRCGLPLTRGHDHLTEYDLAQYTTHRPRQNPTTKTERIRKRHTEWVPETRQTHDNHRRKRPVGSQWEPERGDLP
eukprot:scaffold7504_cov121-Isochrysis_galbana.AAC.4